MTYAAQFCQLTRAELELIYVHPVWEQLLMLQEYNVLHADTGDQMETELKQLSQMIHYKYNVQCTYDVRSAATNLNSLIEEKCVPGVMVIAGTNGADKFVQRIFGSLTFRLSKGLTIPVLVIPDDVEFENIRQLVYAWDYHPHESCLKCLENYAEDLDSKLVFLHVSRHETEISKDVFRAVTGSMKRKLKGSVKAEFNRLYCSWLRKGLNDYMKTQHGSILVISYRNGNMLKKFFNRSETPGTLFSYPMLVLHAEQ
jgi:hypothetical protein